MPDTSEAAHGIAMTTGVVLSVVGMIAALYGAAFAFIWGHWLAFVVGGGVASAAVGFTIMNAVEPQDAHSPTPSDRQRNQ